MAIKTHMEKWKSEHFDNLCHPLYEINWMALCAHPGRRELFYLDYFGGWWYGKNNIKESKPCDTCNPAYMNISNELIEKMTVYEINNELYIGNEIKVRELDFVGRPYFFWTAKKCRCFTCDLVRLSHRLGKARSKSLDPSLNKKYARIFYNSGTKRWITMTVSQMKTLKEKERRENRNAKSTAMEIVRQLANT